MIGFWRRSFLSTLSLRRATIIFRCVCQGLKYFYPRSPCGERPPRAGHCRGCDGISIHALLAESDAGRQPVLVQIVEFLSTLSLRRATRLPTPSTAPWIFLSTLSLRRATAQTLQTRARWGNFYPRSPCGERRGFRVRQGLYLRISIHALLAESDTRKVHDWINGAISIPALLAESDLTQDLPIWRRPYFYPRSPCGERQNHNIRIIVSKAFLSTLSLRRATRAGWQPWTVRRYFYPRSPCGERRAVSVRQHNF